MELGIVLGEDDLGHVLFMNTFKLSGGFVVRALIQGSLVLMLMPQKHIASNYGVLTRGTMVLSGR
jgi:hypothetical protein